MSDGTLQLAQRSTAPSGLGTGISGIWFDDQGILHFISDEGIDSNIGTGWFATNETWTYASADDPTYTFTISGDKTGKYSVGMRIKLTQTSVKYFIITTVSYSSGTGLTTITIYGGTDYDLANSSISDPYFSTHKAPQGFPLDPAKWSIEVTDTTVRSQSAPTSDTWYNLGGLSISIPIGIWMVSIQGVVQQDNNTGGVVFVNVKATLSTDDSSETDRRFTITCTGNTSNTSIQAPFYRENPLELTSKTVYYLNGLTQAGGTNKNIYLRSDENTTVIRAVCAYL